MFARTVRMHLKPNSVTQFTQTMEKDVIPVLRKQPGFRDEVTFLPADGSGDAVAISFWEKRENADAYQRGDLAAATTLNRSWKSKAESAATRLALPAQAVSSTWTQLDGQKDEFRSFAPGSIGGKHAANHGDRQRWASVQRRPH